MSRIVKIVVEGRVQGVFFRGYSLKKAEALGVTGSVENLPNGTVQIFASADAKDIEAYIHWCHNGSPFSRVDRVVVTEIIQDVEFSEFKIV